MPFRTPASFSIRYDGIALSPLCSFCFRVVCGSGLVDEASIDFVVLLADIAVPDADFVVVAFGVWGVVWPRAVVATSSEPMSNLIMTLS